MRTPTQLDTKMPPSGLQPLRPCLCFEQLPLTSPSEAWQGWQQFPAQEVGRAYGLSVASGKILPSQTTADRFDLDQTVGTPLPNLPLDALACGFQPFAAVLPHY
jgi:hypothetical protein